MKPCFGKRKLIACLVLGELDARRAQALRAHLATCDGCRGYLEDISAVGERLAAHRPEPEIEASSTFHRKWLARLRTEQRPAVSAMLTAWSSWRVAVPALGAAALVLLVLWMSPRPPRYAPPTRLSRPAAPTSARDLAPTVANYERVAARSLDDLDDLLTQQAKRFSPRGPIYTAALAAPPNMAD